MRYSTRATRKVKKRKTEKPKKLLAWWKTDSKLISVGTRVAPPGGGSRRRRWCFRVLVGGVSVNGCCRVLVVLRHCCWGHWRRCARAIVAEVAWRRRRRRRVQGRRLRIRRVGGFKNKSFAATAAFASARETDKTPRRPHRRRRRRRLRQ